MASYTTRMKSSKQSIIGVDGIATTAADTLPYGKYRIEESNAPEGYLTDGAKPIEFEITEDGKIVDLTDEAHSIYNQIGRGDIEGVKMVLALTSDLRMFPLGSQARRLVRAISL